MMLLRQMSVIEYLMLLLKLLKVPRVETVEPDIKNSQVTLKGIFEPSKLVEYVYKRTGKHVVIVKQDPEYEEAAGQEDAKVLDMKKNEFYYYHPPNYQVYHPTFTAEPSYSSHSYPLAPQMWPCLGYLLSLL